MSRRKKDIDLQDVEILDVATEGKSITRVEGKVVFVQGVVPGDIADIKIYRSKKSYAEAKVMQITKYSDRRTETKCRHFGDCGGCKWQMLDYRWQLYYKQKQVEENFRHIGKFEFPPLQTILGSEKQYYYRNKLEYTFSTKRWITAKDAASGDPVADQQVLGFHAPGRFDKVLPIEECLLQPDLSNTIRNTAYQLALEQELPFYDLRQHTGLLRNLLIRNTEDGQWLVAVIFAENDEKKITTFMDAMITQVPKVQNWMYVVNTKLNDTLHDQEFIAYKGPGILTETMENLKFLISPKAFFQTNSSQARVLYEKTREFAGLSGHELVYDLYTGTGTIACFIAGNAAKVIGIEYVEDAVADARKNAALNGITHMDFFAGDMKDVLTPDFVEQHGKPDVIITDPPRAGMHQDVVNRILEIAPEKIVYVSCNPATQARDIAWLSEKYAVQAVQPVDMFPHTHHVENIALLIRK